MRFSAYPINSHLSTLVVSLYSWQRILQGLAVRITRLLIDEVKRVWESGVPVANGVVDTYYCVEGGALVDVVIEVSSEDSLLLDYPNRPSTPTFRHVDVEGGFVLVPNLVNCCFKAANESVCLPFLMPVETLHFEFFGLVVIAKALQ